MVLNIDGIMIEMVKVYKFEVNSEEMLDKLDDMLIVYVKGVEFKVDGEVIGIVKD